MKDKYIFMPAATSLPCVSFSDSGNVCDMIHRWIECDCFEIVHIGRQLGLKDDVILIVDDCGKLKPHLINDMGSYFYGAGSMDYIAGDCIVARIGLVPPSDPEFPYPEHDVLPLTPKLYRFFADFFKKTGRKIWEDYE